ncbi:lantibiotic ABC transporter permease [Sporosarcina sp. P37]|uniref:tryptophan-rich sensory protein n=1 Tax=unclassified Sporosarcina TaxID=2647733 RepID=UPI000A17A837|nr:MULTISPECIES: tryptophan-rich sensory protein [unclassified Sporosarcina]ARK24837.1 lantibiotic ABC transporter permease [Sporosarcina sp. P37]PID19997.1 lantibiotic ABC transporter permease [Sporosarcina sp. P35]
MRSDKTSVFLRAAIFITYAIMITANTLANILPLNGQTTGELSDKYRNLFAPAGFTFSIWSLIYLLLLGHVIYQLGLFQKRKNPELLRQVGIFFIISSVLNASWIFLWHYEYLLFSVIVMLLLLLTLIKITAITSNASLTSREVFFIKLPFSIYFGWITIATIANITAFLVSIDWSGFGISDVTWTIIIVFLGAAIGIITAVRRQDIAYALVLVWAYYGIYSKHISANGFNGEYPAIITSVIICLLLIAVSIGFIAVKKLRQR